MIGSHSARILPPNPPPHSIGITLMRFSGSSRTSATSDRVLNEPWVLAHKVRLPCPVPLGQDGVGLEVALVDHRNAVGLLDDHVRLGERLRHVPALQARLLRDVDGLRRLGLGRHAGDGAVGQRLARVGLGPDLGDRRSAGLHRLERIGGDGQDLVLHLDQIERLLGDRELIGGDGCDRLAREHDAVDRQHGVRARRRLFLQHGDVGGRQHRAHARQRPRPAHIDARRSARGRGGCGGAWRAGGREG